MRQFSCADCEYYVNKMVDLRIIIFAAAQEAMENELGKDYRFHDNESWNTRREKEWKQNKINSWRL